jgi:hypothetical protein
MKHLLMLLGVVLSTVYSGVAQMPDVEVFAENGWWKALSHSGDRRVVFEWTDSGQHETFSNMFTLKFSPEENIYICPSDTNTKPKLTNWSNVNGRMQYAVILHPPPRRIPPQSLATPKEEQPNLFLADSFEFDVHFLGDCKSNHSWC